MKLTLAALRVNNGMSQKEVAEHMGVNIATVSRWENSHVIPSNAVIYTLANLYNVDITKIKFNSE